MRVLCEWMRGETNYIARPFGPVQKLLPACLPIFGKRDVRIRGDSASSASSASAQAGQKVGYN